MGLKMQVLMKSKNLTKRKSILVNGIMEEEEVEVEKSHHVHGSEFSDDSDFDPKKNLCAHSFNK